MIAGALILTIRFEYTVGVPGFSGGISGTADVRFSNFAYDDLTETIWYYNATSIPGNHWASLSLSELNENTVNSSTGFLDNLWNNSGTQVLPPSFKNIKNGYPESQGAHPPWGLDPVPPLTPSEPILHPGAGE